MRFHTFLSQHLTVLTSGFLLIVLPIPPIGTQEKCAVVWVKIITHIQNWVWVMNKEKWMVTSCSLYKNIELIWISKFESNFLILFIYWKLCNSRHQLYQYFSSNLQWKLISRELLIILLDYSNTRRGHLSFILSLSSQNQLFCHTNVHRLIHYFSMETCNKMPCIVGWTHDLKTQKEEVEWSFHNNKVSTTR